MSGGFAVDVSFTDVSATGAAALGAGIDYVNSAQTLNFAGSAGETVMFTVLVNEDAVLEVDEGFTLALGNVLPATAPFTSIDVSDTASGTINDNDTAAVTIADVASDESGNLLFTATLDNAVSGGFAVDVSFTDVSATGAAALGAGIDYVNSAQTLNFAGSAGETVMFTVLVNEDAVLEVDEGFTLALGNVLPATAPFTSIDVSDTASGTINDNDTAAVTIADVASDESGNLLFTATLDNAVSGGFAVDVSFTDVSATGAAALGAGIDYVNSAQTLNFAGSAGETVMFTVLVNEDAVLEVDEGFTLALGNVLPATAPFTSIDVSDTASGTITDNDTAAVTIADVASDESGNLLFTATLDNAVSGGFAVDVSFTDVSATGAAALGAGIDYVNSAQTLNFAGSAGETVMFTVLVNEDAVLEVDEGFTLALGNVLPATAPFTSIDVSDTASGTITDNDTANAANLSVTTQGNEAGPVAIVYTVTLDQTNNTGTPITFDLSFTGGTATGGADYDDTVAGAGVITVADGATTGQLIVPVIDDALVEGTELVDATISNPSSGVVTIGTATASAGIVDDEVTNATITATQANAAEPGTNGQFTVDLGAVNATGGVVTLTYTITGTATDGTDYTALAGTVDVANGQQTATIDVAVVDDVLLEPAETVTLTLTNSSNVMFGFDPTPATVTITDNDTAEVTIVATDAGAAEATPAGADNGQFTVTLSQASNTDTIIAYTIGGDAIAGTDYTTLPGTVTITANATTATIDLSVLDDLILEDNETVTVTLNSISSGDADITIGTANADTVSISDNDAAQVAIAASDATASETTPAGTDNGRFTVTLSQASDTDTVISYTASGDASPGSDYTTLSGTVTILANTTSASIDVTVLDDMLLENNEAVTVTLNNIVSGDADITIGVANADTVAIADNETATADFSVSTQGSEAGPVAIVYTVTLNQTNNTGAPITFDVNFSGGTATGGTDYDNTVAGAGVITIADGASTGQLIVPVNDDVLVEGTELVDATISNPSSAAVTIGTATASAGIVDDEVTNATITATQANAVEPGTNGQFTVDLGAVNATGGVVTLTYVNTGTATDGTDYTALAGTVDIANGQQTATIDVVVTDDVLLEPAETVTLTLTNSSNVMFGFDPTPATVTIGDDDTLIITLSNGSDAAEPASDGQFIVDLGTLNNTGAAINVTYAVAGTATAGSDYSAVTGTVVIGAGAQTATVDVNVIDDALLEGAETVVLTLTGTDNASVAVDATPATVIIVDDEAPPVAQDDNFALIQDTVLNGNVLGDNGNGADTDANSDPLQVNVTPLVGTANGVLVLNSDGTFSYTPTPGFVGSDTFTYEVADGTGGVDSAIVSITVSATGGAATPDPADDVLVVPDNLTAAGFIPDALPPVSLGADPNLDAAGAVLDAVNDAADLGFQITSPMANGAVLSAVAEASSAFFGDAVNTASADRVGFWDAEGLKAYSIRFALNETDGTGIEDRRFPLRIEAPGEIEDASRDALIIESFLRDRTLYISVNYLVTSEPELEAVLYSAALANGDPLPDWLRMNPSDGLLTGTPPIGAELLQLRIEVQLNDEIAAVRYVQLNLVDGEISELRRVSDSLGGSTSIFSSQISDAGSEFERAVQQLMGALSL